MYVRLKNGFLTAVYDFVTVICSFYDAAEMDLLEVVHQFTKGFKIFYGS